VVAGFGGIMNVNLKNGVACGEFFTQVISFVGKQFKGID